MLLFARDAVLRGADVGCAGRATRSPGDAAPCLCYSLKKAAGVAGLARGDLFGYSLGNDLPAFIPSFRPEIDDPIRAFDHVKVVFDDQHGMAGINEALKDFEQQADIVEVQAGGGFVEEEQCAFQIRSSKSEIRMKPEIRRPSSARNGTDFGFRVSNFFRFSVFGFRICHRRFGQMSFGFRFSVFGFVTVVSARWLTSLSRWLSPPESVLIG